MHELFHLTLNTKLVANFPVLERDSVAVKKKREVDFCIHESRSLEVCMGQGGGRSFGKGGGDSSG